MADIFVEKTTAASSNLGVDVYLIGATRDLAINQTAVDLPSCIY